MKYTDIVTDKRIAARAAWAVFILCTLIMYAMAYFSSWAAWVPITLTAHAVVLTVLTFHPKTVCRVQPLFLTLFSFSNIFIPSF